MGSLTESYNSLLEFLDTPLFDPEDRTTFLLEQHAALAALEDRRTACQANPAACDLTANEYVETKNQLENNIAFHESYINNWDIYGGIIESAALGVAGGAIRVVSTGLPAAANFAQKTYNKYFSDYGQELYSNLAGYAIRTVDDLANAIQRGDISIDDVPVQTITRDGQTLILNTRTAKALEQAGVDRSLVRVEDATGDELFEDLLDKQLSRNNLTNSGVSEVRPSNIECFLAGTLISFSDGSARPIEEISTGDQVLTYNFSGELVAGRVTRTFQNEVSHLLNVHGLKVTPGHVTLCGDGQFAGKHVPIIDILLSDGALVKEDASLIRVAINKPVGSLEDQFVKVSYALTSEDAQSGNLQSGEMRVGTLLFDKGGTPVSVLDCIRAEGMTFDPETGLVCREEQSPEPLYFYGPLPRPEDYILRRSRETLEGILADGEWEGSQSELIAQRLRRTGSARLN